MQSSSRALILGMMSGTSLDGLDLCLVRISETDGVFSYLIAGAETVPYPGDWLVRLKAAENCNGVELVRMDSDYGRFLGEAASAFLEKNPGEKPLLIASHGHTIFHRPDLGYTYQLGSGASLAAAASLPVVCDFRSTDVALGGQGAPLVPVGDALLFGDYTYCLNLGGFANISFAKNGGRIAFDICPVNYVLNRVAKRAGMNFDAGGKLAASGKIIPELLERLNAIPFYKIPPPKSLGREWAESAIFPVLSSAYSTEDLLRTFTEHAAMQIGECCNAPGKMLVTGGGAHNHFFVERLRAFSKAEVVVPDAATIDFKEALIFAFLGWLRWNGRVNVLASVTGAKTDSSSGAIYLR